MRAGVLIIALFGCGAALQPRSDACIVTAQQAHDLYAPGDRYFTPSDADVRAMQTWLAAYLRGNDGTDRIVERLARYRGVVYGVIVNGHHVLRASYNCSAHGPCSEDVGTISLDGGDCNFDVDFDLNARRYTYLSVSGIASTDERRPTRPATQCALSPKEMRASQSRRSTLPRRCPFGSDQKESDGSKRNVTERVIGQTLVEKLVL